MTTDAKLKPWTVIILSAGYGNEKLRDAVYKFINELGFSAAVYDRPGYPVPPRQHSHTSCIEAVKHHDIAIALVDEKEGGSFQLNEVPASVKSELTNLGVLSEHYEQGPPLTILQAEILTAKAQGKPVICLVPESVRNLCHRTLKNLPNLIADMKPRRDGAPVATDLINSKSWTDLHNNYIVPTEEIPFGQLAFLERIRHERPNYISYFNDERQQELKDHIISRLAPLPLEIAQLNEARAEKEFPLRRTAVAGSGSLDWLRERGLLISGPYKADAGANMNDLPLISDGHSVALSEYLRNGTSTILLGNHGTGKSSYCLLTALDHFRHTHDMHACLLFGSWSELPTQVQRGTADQLIRALIGIAAERRMWPEVLPLPSANWHIVLDGVDENKVEIEVSSLRRLFHELRSFGTLLVSCREYEFDKRLYPLQECFERILRLRPLGQEEIDRYRNILALRGGNERMLEYINSQLDPYPGVIGIPLWLTMLTFLGDSIEADSNNPQESGLSPQESDFDLLSQCARAFASYELDRHLLNVDNEMANLLRTWQIVAWEIHKAKRQGSTQLTEAALRELAKIPGDNRAQLWNACHSLLTERNDVISGFQHPLLLEFWLADYTVTTMVTPGSAIRLLEALSLSRSATANRLIRQGAARPGSISAAVAGLREAFWHAGTEDNFAKSQILHLLGRIDPSSATQRFLLTIWNNMAEATFARYSAAHALAGMGVDSVERELCVELSTNESLGNILCWFYGCYRGEFNANERGGFDFDKAHEVAISDVPRLMDRLRGKQPWHLNLRLFELFMLRSLLESQGIEVAPPDLAAELDLIESESLLLQRDSQVNLIGDEINQIRKLLERNSRRTD